MADTTLNTYLFDLAKEILAECVDILSDAGITPPEIQAVWPGEIVDEGCDQISVGLERLYNGLPGLEAASPEAVAEMAWARSASYVVRIVRCVNSGNDRGRPPTVTEIEDDAEATYSDIWAIHQGLVTRYHAGTFLEACQSFLVGNALPAGPDGGVGGWTITLDMAVS